MRKTLLLLLLFWVPFYGFSIEAYFDLKKFQLPNGENYIETYLSFTTNGVGYTRLDNGLLQAEVEATIIIQQGDNIIDFKKINILSPQVTDSTLTEFLDVQKFILPNGPYTIDVKLKDLNDLDNGDAALTQQFILGIRKDQVDFSDVMLLNSATKCNEPGPLTKSGFDLVPHVSDYYSSLQDKLIFYTELYHTDMLSDSLFVLSTFISEKFTDDPVDPYMKIERAKAKSIMPILKSFDISELETGYYTLHIEMRNRQNELLLSQEIEFQRNNFKQETTLESIEQVDISRTFVSLYDDRDSLLEHLNSCHPIASNLERSSIENQMQYADLPTLQKYFFYFWSRRSEAHPDLAWAEYKKQVDYVDEEYGTRVKKGYESDRGRVYLQYGKPNTIVVRHNPPNVLPYEIWHYYTIGDFNNRRFLFYSREAVAVDFVLLHSDMLGEVQNNDWPVIMRTENVEMNTSSSQQNSISRRNAFSGNELEDLFYNPR
ncbi:MAG: GWxTD domain-containing protein [Flavobacteriales bacterium]|nr:GWxTD domain-containing protein [Flavobacteriales bacterium]